MTRHTMATIGIALLAGSAAFAQSDDKRLETWLATCDANGDEALTLNEIRTLEPDFLSAAFAKYDRDRDGLLTQKDLDQLRAANSEAVQRVNTIREFLTYDMGDNGRVGLKEIQAKRPAATQAEFTEHDLDKDGFITHTDLVVAERMVDEETDENDDTKMLQEILAKIRAVDANRDRAITFEEATAQFPNLTREQFNALDRNGDETLSRADLSSRPKR